MDRDTLRGKEALGTPRIWRCVELRNGRRIDRDCSRSYVGYHALQRPSLRRISHSSDKQSLSKTLVSLYSRRLIPSVRRG